MRHLILTILLILGATAVSADYFNKKQAFEIIENGKIIHSAIVKQGGKCSRFAIPTDSRNNDKAGMEIHDVVNFYLKSYVRDAQTLIVNEDITRSFKWNYNCEHLN